MNGDPVTFSESNAPAAKAASPAPGAMDAPDYLAGALLQSLMRPMVTPYAPGVIGTPLVALLTMGIAPLFLMPRRMRAFVARERDQFWHLAQWLRGQFGTDADSLDPRTPGLDRFTHILRLVSWGSGLIALAGMLWYMNIGLGLEDLINATYKYWNFADWHPFGNRDSTVYGVWIKSLCVGYAAQWLAVIVHQMRVRAFIQNFNALAQKHSFRPVVMPGNTLGIRPLWLLGAICFAGNGVIWGIPLMLAGAAQTRYIRNRSRWIRQELAQRVRDVLRLMRPAMILTVPVALRRKCPTSLCQAPLPQIAVFCPRCGMRVAAVDQVA